MDISSFYNHFQKLLGHMYFQIVLGKGLGSVYLIKIQL
jgi:hypothetical protein